MRKAVHFGAGNIGRGFLGQLYFESGYEIVFVDVVDEVVTALRQRGEYPVRIVAEEEQTILVRNVTAVHGNDLDAVAGALAEADLVSTAVGVNVLPHIAPALTRGITLRFQGHAAQPLNIIVCENLINAGSFLRAKVEEHLAPEYLLDSREKVGFVEASIGRMVPVMTAAQRAEDPLLVCVEPYCELPVDANGFKGPIPQVRHMKPMPNFAAYVERKLFVHNLSHAATAYLGYLRGHEYIWQAIRDAKVRAAVDAATAESCRALSRKHALDPAGLDAHRADLIHRYHNRALGDQVARVARDPLRKLGPNDRLAGAAKMCIENGVDPVHIGFAVAAAMLYDPPSDPAAHELQRLRQSRGVAGVLQEVCQILPGSPLETFVEKGLQRLHDEGWKT